MGEAATCQDPDDHDDIHIPEKELVSELILESLQPELVSEASLVDGVQSQGPGCEFPPGWPFQPQSLCSPVEPWEGAAICSVVSWHGVSRAVQEFTCLPLTWSQMICQKGEWVNMQCPFGNDGQFPGRCTCPDGKLGEAMCLVPDSDGGEDRLLPMEPRGKLK